ncbi:hypothetical protein F0U47_20540, partial [Nocardioides antri]
ETYSSENDDLDIEALVGNIDSLKAFIGCFLETSPCDAVSGDFKKDIPEAVAEAGGKCTPAQQRLFQRYLEVVKDKLPQEYEAFKTKYDPQGKHFDALLSAVANS